MSFVATAAFSATLAGNFLLAVMRDNQVAKHAQAHLERLHTDLDYLDNMDPFITDTNLFLSSCLPNATTSRSLDDCSAKASQLQKSDLFKFAFTDAQGELKAASALLADLGLQRLPPRSENLSDEECLDTVIELPLFVEFTGHRKAKFLDVGPHTPSKSTLVG
eukprot:923878-Amphidinium_carterae.2